MARKPKKAVPLALRLYVVGTAPNSILAIANIKALCDAHFTSRHELEIVDLLLDPLRAIEDQIIVTPTLVKLAPPPVRRVIGHLGDTEQVLVTLASK